MPVPPSDGIIVQLINYNPHKPGTLNHRDFEFCAGEPTVQEFLDRGGRMRFLRHFMKYGDLSVKPAPPKKRVVRSSLPRKE